MSLIKKHPLLTILFIGLIIRVALMFTTFSFDVNNHISWAQDAIRRGLPGFYETQSKEVYGAFFPNYPPLAIISFSVFYFLAELIQKFFWFLNLTIPVFPSKLIFFVNSREFVAGMVKIPGVLGDVGIAYVIYLSAKKLFTKKISYQYLFPALISLNPVFIYNSSLWGQIDPLAIFLMMTSFYLLVYSKKNIMSVIFFVLAILVKPTIFISLPVYGLFFFNKFNWGKIIQYFILANIVFWLFFMFFYKTGNIFLYPYSAYLKMIVSGQGQSGMSVSAFNIWSIFPWVMKIKNSALSIAGYSLAIITILLTFLKYFRCENKIKMIFFAGFIINMVIFLFAPRMHERYIIFALPFLLLITPRWFIILSIMTFINLYYSWAAFKFLPFIFFISHPAMISLISIVNLSSFIYLFKNYLLDLSQKNLVG